MFDIGWSELLLIGVVALIAIGPKELPGVLRAIGQWTAKIRRMAGEFQGQFQEALREAEMADLKKQVDDINESARAFAKFDPLAEAAKTATPAATPAVTPSPSETTPTQAALSDVAPGDVTPDEAKPSEAAALPPPVPEPTPVPAATTEPVSAAAALPVETPPSAATPTIETTPATQPAPSAEPEPTPAAPAPPAPGERPA
jgi:sec-independent protein translocase protein TatB